MSTSDDIADPPLPPELQKNLLDMVRGCHAAIGSLSDAMAARLSQLSPIEAGALEHLCQALEALAACGTEAPNSLHFEAVSPQGFRVQLILRRRTAKELFDALGKSQEYLLTQGYTPI